MYRKIIVGHDLHDGGDDALALGRQLAEASDAKLVVAGVFPFGMLPHGFEEHWREEEEKVAAEIDHLAEAAYGPSRRVLLGSVSAALVKAAPCPLLVHPRGAGMEAGRLDSASG